jgi:ubiquinone/menaquinone biosynthesis C-methylase UbiE
MSNFDFDSVFGEDYLHFYEGILTDEVSDRQVATIARLVKVGPGIRVLDCPCGHGRIANRLARLGAEVVGVDSSQPFLEVAREADAGVEYRLGDMRELEFDAEFDVMVNVYTSFGYFDDETDRRVLAGFRRALKVGGKLVMDHQNSHRILSLIAALGGESVAMSERGDDLLIDRNRYDATRGRTVTERISVRDGKVRRYPFSVRIFTPAELAAWLQHAGFAQVEVFDEEGDPFTLAARRMWVVATA